ncbi:GGDEF domain-containing phosphodiesterase [Petrocella sp. FN5]|uniref:GGDEF domain-containing phosphodiesterase n=1 Tax=Petrocella sp. FN5 TaxID=3032002 RepID=UPI0023DB5984|nr:GGDEF domain-containing phosphodiesterase [Petrocella sp. FN5]MDF1617087.1 EAL domain-containing protein [Petrocella sp. FN5]
MNKKYLFKRRNAIICSIVFISLFFNMKTFAMQDGSQHSYDYPHVLLINSYHKGFGWTDTQTDAIIEAFRTYNENIIVSVEYLDWKRYPNEENLDLQYGVISHKYKYVNTDLIITTDDIAMEFAIQHRDGIFAGKPIVYTGVLEESAIRRTQDVENIIGVYEVLDSAGTVDLMLELQPEIHNIYVVCDATESGKDVSHAIVEAIESSDTNLSYRILDDLSYEQIMTLLEGAQEGNAVIMGTYTMDSQGKKKSNETFSKELAEITTLPMYTVYEYLLDYGVIGGSLLSGTMQGTYGAGLAIGLIEGTPMESLETVNIKPVYYGFDYIYLEKNNIDLEDIPAGSVVINRPISYYEMHREVILIYSGVTLILLVFVIILSYNVKMRKKAQKDLEEEHNALVSTYEALTASEEELKAQNEELIEQQEKINYLAYNDFLTKLPNRLHMEKYFAKLVKNTNRLHSKVMMAFIDIDNFNYINTAHGHQIGDRLLQEISDLFKSYVQDKGTIGRIGGDEFICLVGIEERFDCKDYIDGLMDKINRSLEISGKQLFVTASIGYAIYPDDGLTYDELLIRADMAMYKMKSMGKAKASRFDIEMNQEMTDKINLTNALKYALLKDEFHLVYQPQYNSKSQKIVGYEALIRWNSHTLGQVSPIRFIPIAESTGDIVEIGKKVIEEAARFAKRINNSDGDIIKVAVNISVVQLLHSDFVDIVKTIIETEKVNPKWFEFEVTESVLIKSFDLVNKQLKVISEMGIDIALDDFGTGYSSLTYLRKLPISTLKIDKTFIDDILNEGENHFFTRAIIDIAHRLNFRVVAEGVEEQFQLDYLRAGNCNTIQGYLFSKPLIEGDAVELLQNYK